MQTDLMFYQKSSLGGMLDIEFAIKLKICQKILMLGFVPFQRTILLMHRWPNIYNWTKQLSSSSKIEGVIAPLSRRPWSDEHESLQVKFEKCFMLEFYKCPSS